jgi:hypothetical protein
MSGRDGCPQPSAAARQTRHFVPARRNRLRPANAGRHRVGNDVPAHRRETNVTASGAILSSRASILLIGALTGEPGECKMVAGEPTNRSRDTICRSGGHKSHPGGFPRPAGGYKSAPGGNKCVLGGNIFNPKAGIRNCLTADYADNADISEDQHEPRSSHRNKYERPEVCMIGFHPRNAA